MLVLLLSSNALANSILFNLPQLRVYAGCWVNPLLLIFALAAEISLTLKIISSATASHLK